MMPLVQTTPSFRRLVVAAATTILLGSAVLSPPAEAQQRAFPNPATATAAGDLDITTVAVDANAQSLTIRLDVENLPQNISVVVHVTKADTFPTQGRALGVGASFTDGKLIDRFASQRIETGDTVWLPEQAVHATRSGQSVEVAVDQPHVGWAGPYYVSALAEAVVGGERVIAQASARRTDTHVTGFGPFTSDQDVPLTRLTLSRGADARVTLTATISPAIAGRVTFFDGAMRLGDAPAPRGAATFALPSGTKPGAHTFRAVFAPTDSLRYTSSSTATSFTVPATLRARLSLSSRVQGRRKPVRATVTVTGALTGSVAVYDGGTRLKVTRFKHGKLTYTLPRKLRAGLHSLRAVVSVTANGSRTTSTSNVARLRVSAT